LFFSGRGRGRGGGGFRGGRTTIVEPHRHSGVFIARGKEDALVTKNLVPGDAVYGEKKIEVEVSGILCVFAFLLCSMNAWHIPTFPIAAITRLAGLHLF